LSYSYGDREGRVGVKSYITVVHYVKLNKITITTMILDIIIFLISMVDIIRLHVLVRDFVWNGG